MKSGSKASGWDPKPHRDGAGTWKQRDVPKPPMLCALRCPGNQGLVRWSVGNQGLGELYISCPQGHPPQEGRSEDKPDSCSWFYLGHTIFLQASISKCIVAGK